MLRILLSCAIGLGLLLSGTARADEVTVKIANIQEFEKAIAAHKGKVVVVDVWGLFCAPCKAKFPSVVKMYKDYAKEGLVVISLSLDEPDQEKEVLAFLKKNDADFPNFILKDTEENKDAWDKRFPFMSPPVMHIFGRDGKLVKSLERQKEIDMIEQMVKEQLKK
ncbi:MAG: TlpA family protein disulfide reductase [Gemmataceae bacterium]|jgi:thiol-disulfide isomerase/thioredoxin|nr:TlpA family protein disulfide reductase [Gemmataceae bacterium]